MLQAMDEIHTKRAINLRIVNDMPLICNTFKVRWKFVRVELDEGVSDAFEISVRVLEVGCDLGVAIDWRGWARDISW